MGMASLIGHTAVALTGAYVFRPIRSDIPSERKVPWWGGSILISLLPDIDVLTFLAGVPYGSFWGHRGFTHSILFSVLAGYFLAQWFQRFSERVPPWKVWVYFSAVGVTHPLLDMMTSGGLGVALLSPIWTERLFFIFRPIVVSPIGVRAFFSEWGVHVLASELLVVVLPCLAFVTARLLIDRRLRKGLFREGSPDE